MFRSLRVRMAASHAAVLAIIVVALGGGGLLLLGRDLDRQATSDLEAAARDQTNRILEARQVIPPPDSDLPSRAAVRIAVFLPGGDVVGETTEVPGWLHPYSAHITDATVGGEPVRVITVAVLAGGRTVATVVAAKSLLSEELLLHRIRLLLLGGGALAIVASLGAGWWLSSRAVRPVIAAYEAQAGFAADASHELRTPLTFIRSAVEVLAERDPELGTEVLGEVDYLTRLTERLLALARAERGTLTLNRAPFEVASLCRSSARRSTAAMGTRLVLDGRDAHARGDAVATEAALDAVLENVSVHADGEASVRWRCEGGRVLISVEDRGPGLPPELARTALDRFARGDTSRTRRTGGAGLGLSLARVLVEAQGGSIALSGTPGGGLTVTLALPAT